MTCYLFRRRIGIFQGSVLKEKNNFAHTTCLLTKAYMEAEFSRLMAAERLDELDKISQELLFTGNPIQITRIQKRIAQLTHQAKAGGEETNNA